MEPVDTLQTRLCSKLSQPLPETYLASVYLETHRQDRLEAHHSTSIGVRVLMKTKTRLLTVRFLSQTTASVHRETEVNAQAPLKT